MNQVKIKLGPGATMPTKAYGSGAAGFDLYAAKDVEIRTDMINTVSTEVYLEIPKGFVGLIWDKSGMGAAGCKVYGGVIDSDYRGEVRVMLSKVEDANGRGGNMYIEKGGKVAQILFQRVEDVALEQVDELSVTVRGEKGFGSSGRC